MASPLSYLGIFHTIVSVLALLAAFAILARRGRIDPQSKTGRTYILTTAIGCLTAFGLAKTGRFGPGHGLAVIALLCLVGAWISRARQIKFWLYVETILLTTSLFLSLIPAIMETLTRLPLGAPWASGPEDPLVQRALGILFACFALGLVAQVVVIRRARVKSSA